LSNQIGNVDSSSKGSNAVNEGPLGSNKAGSSEPEEGEGEAPESQKAAESVNSELDSNGDSSSQNDEDSKSINLESLFEDKDDSQREEVVNSNRDENEDERTAPQSTVNGEVVVDRWNPKVVRLSQKRR